MGCLNKVWLTVVHEHIWTWQRNKRSAWYLTPPWTTTEPNQTCPCCPFPSSMTHWNLTLSISHHFMLFNRRSESRQETLPKEMHRQTWPASLVWNGLGRQWMDNKTRNLQWLTSLWCSNMGKRSRTFHWCKCCIIFSKDTFAWKKTRKITMDPSSKTPSFQALRLTRPLVVKISSAEDVVSDSWKEGLRVESH